MTERAKIASEHRAERNRSAPDQPSTGSRKRNTARWCKGKVGKEHDYQPFTKTHYFGTACEISFKYAKCSHCGREEWGVKAKRLLAK